MRGEEGGYRGKGGGMGVEGGGDGDGLEEVEGGLLAILSLYVHTQKSFITKFVPNTHQSMMTQCTK